MSRRDVDLGVLVLVGVLMALGCSSSGKPETAQPGALLGAEPRAEQAEAGGTEGPPPESPSPPEGGQMTMRELNTLLRAFVE